MQSLSVKYRPKTFDDCVGQSAVIKVLTQQINKNQIKHAYLFCGSSGSGKTSLARIVANRINEGNGYPIEIDAASNNGVDNVREIVKQSQERSLSCKYKVFIIDECHALSNAAWQAFLKCIEETPEYTVFIFCTTDPQKIPATIINRCMRFNFTKLNPSQIRDRLEYICKQENLSNYNETIDYISRICKGQLRDAISYLEQVIDYDSNISLENAYKALGMIDINSMFDLINNIIDGNEREVLSILDIYYQQGTNLSLFVDEFLKFTIDLNKFILFNTLDITNIPNFYLENAKRCINISNSSNYYNYVIDKLLQLKNMLKNDPEPFSTIQVILLQIARCQ